MFFFSVVIPVYNRPEELKELLESLKQQDYKNFEVIVVDDGSSIPGKEVAEHFKNDLSLQYYYKNNEGRSIARNYGIDKARGEYIIIFDSDCIIPSGYFTNVSEYLKKNRLDCFGGPDRAHPSFTPIQQAISYSLTSVLTTGGMRGSRHSTTKFYPRSFNMGFTKHVAEAIGGFLNIPLAEDLDFSMRAEKSGFRIGLIESAYVYHKRRTDFAKFYRQLNRFGIGRINLYMRHKEALKLTHFFPSIFMIFSLSSVLLSILNPLYIVPLATYTFCIFFDASVKNNSFKIGILSVAATYVQMYAYANGFNKAFIKRIVLKQPEFGSY
ncbi:MAG: glycosyltransferase [Cytophagaceae bacterium]|nr:glycosyltransferase [Cytophagaceae bacterium]MDW8456006.1 glycosyltransferase [Cytophagaceae bacterium]